jgi:hypothetical protein
MSSVTDFPAQAALAMLAGRFGDRTAALVAAVTNPSWKPGRDQHEQYRQHVLPACTPARGHSHRRARQCRMTRLSHRAPATEPLGVYEVKEVGGEIHARV